MMCTERVSQQMKDKNLIQHDGDNCESRERDMDGTTDEPTGDVTDAETLPPNRALSLLSNETRIAILHVLASAEEEVVPFSTLQKRVGIEDSGQFNYHLNRLAGYYVRHTADGYALRKAGTDALEAISRL